MTNKTEFTADPFAPMLDAFDVACLSFARFGAFTPGWLMAGVSNPPAATHTPARELADTLGDF